MTDRPQLTTLLDALRDGDRRAQDELFALVYAELKRIARGHLRRSAQGMSVNPSTLVHEAFLKFNSAGAAQLQGSAHFYNVMAQAMRQVLLDLARHHAAERHGGDLVRTELGDEIPAELSLDTLLEVDDALAKLAACDADLAQLVEWHFFGGLQFVEIAALRGQNERTVRRHWDMARAFLLKAMRGDAAAE
jgi:RNA polymerase sigma factor (TIGR02999 family)